MNNKQLSLNNFYIGFIAGFILICIVFGIFIFVNLDKFDTLEKFIRYFSTWKTLSSLLSLCAVPNLLIFFWSLNTERYKTTRGIIGVTMIIAIVVFILRLTT